MPPSGPTWLGKDLTKIFPSPSVCVGVIGEPSVPHVESSPLSQGVAVMSQSLAPPIQYLSLIHI